MKQTVDRFKDGQAVRHTDGRLGIVCDDQVRISGRNKGKVFVLFVGSRYGCGDACYPSDLSHVQLCEATRSDRDLFEAARVFGETLDALEKFDAEDARTNRRYREDE